MAKTPPSRSYRLFSWASRVIRRRQYGHRGGRQRQPCDHASSGDRSRNSLCHGQPPWWIGNCSAWTACLTWHTRPPPSSGEAALVSRVSKAPRGPAPLLGTTSMQLLYSRAWPTPPDCRSAGLHAGWDASGRSPSYGWSSRMTIGREYCGRTKRGVAGTQKWACCLSAGRQPALSKGTSCDPELTLF